LTSHDAECVPISADWRAGRLSSGRPTRWRASSMASSDWPGSISPPRSCQPWLRGTNAALLGSGATHLPRARPTARAPARAVFISSGGSLVLDSIELLSGDADSDGPPPPS